MTGVFNVILIIYGIFPYQFSIRFENSCQLIHYVANSLNLNWILWKILNIEYLIRIHITRETRNNSINRVTVKGKWSWIHFRNQNPAGKIKNEPWHAHLSSGIPSLLIFSLSHSGVIGITEEFQASTIVILSGKHFESVVCTERVDYFSISNWLNFSQIPTTIMIPTICNNYLLHLCAKIIGIFPLKQHVTKTSLSFQSTKESNFFSINFFPMMESSMKDKE